MLKNQFKIGYLILLLSILVSCSSSDAPKQKVGKEVSSEQIKKAKKIFYSLPSPIETCVLLKSSGAKYEKELLNPIDNIPSYTTTLDKAINLGVYGADLSFVSMFEQSETLVKYLSATKNLADQLGILGAIDEVYITRVQDNINNKDSIVEIISETFMNTNSFLKENDQEELSAIILAGGWLEGLYIATQVAQQNDCSYLKRRIMDQEISLNTLFSLLGNYKDNRKVQTVVKELEKIQVAFSKMKNKSKAKGEDCKKEGENPQCCALKDLTKVVIEVRNKFIK